MPLEPEHAETGPPFTTARLELRDFASTDLESFHNFQNHPDFLEHYPWDYWSRAQSERLVNRFVRWSHKVPRVNYQLAVVEHDSETLVGTVGVRRPGISADTGEVGYALDPAFWGRGYAREAVSEIVTFACTRLHLEELKAMVFSSNSRSVSLLWDLGFTEDVRLSVSQDDLNAAAADQIQFVRTCR